MSLSVDDQILGDEVATLERVLGDVIQSVDGTEARRLAEEVRRASLARRAGGRDAEKRLSDLVSGIDAKHTEILIAAFSIFFDLANLAEDRHRVRVLRQRERERHPEPRSESLADAIARLRASGSSADDVRSILDLLDIELVFTAHPTEAKRKSVREKIRDLREHLGLLDRGDLLPAERERLWALVRGDLFALWQTDLLRQRRPTVLEEVNRALFFATTLWEVVPALYEDMREALLRYYPSERFDLPTFLRFGSWIGGDRDGHPGVTWQVTSSTLERLREAALTLHIAQCRAVRRSLSVSDSRVKINRLRAAMTHALDRWPQTVRLIEPIAPGETCRRWLRVVQWRLEQTIAARPFQPMPEGAYAGAAELREDVGRLEAVLDNTPGGETMAIRLRRWRTQIDVFGFHLNRLDIRQESSWYHRVLDEVLRAADVCPAYRDLAEPQRQAVLTRSMPCEGEIDEPSLSDDARETLALFRLLADTVRTSGDDALGAHVISMTHTPSDVLAVLWLGARAARMAGLRGDRLPMPIVPLFETIDDLREAPQTLEALLSHPQYRAHIEATSSGTPRQVAMIGYSDSTKDGGYLSASWNLYRAQMQMHDATARHGVRLVIFHGRGGSLGRGGGPAARSIRSLPPHTVQGALRVTEQGEVLAERYDDPHIAHRHLEQVTWATLLVTSEEEPPPKPAWVELMEQLSAAGRRAYRELVDRPGFITYFEYATPISEIEQLPIGSRPARRAGQRSLDALRAIPWVFSWTQSRHMLPAWYGVGAAIEMLRRERQELSDELREMYRRWAFFKATIDNAELALAKADMGIARHYAMLVPDGSARESIWSAIDGEFARSRDAVLAITGNRELLDGVPWLKRSIAVRNPYVDPLNFIQADLLKRLGEHGETDDAAEVETRRQLARLSIQAIAGGLRTTG